MQGTTTTHYDKDGNETGTSVTEPTESILTDAADALADASRPDGLLSGDDKAEDDATSDPASVEGKEE